MHKLHVPVLFCFETDLHVSWLAVVLQVLHVVRGEGPAIH